MTSTCTQTSDFNHNLFSVNSRTRAVVVGCHDDRLSNYGDVSVCKSPAAEANYFILFHHRVFAGLSALDLSESHLHNPGHCFEQFYSLSTAPSCIHWIKGETFL